MQAARALRRPILARAVGLSSTILLVGLGVLTACGSSEKYEPRSGDIVFQTSRSSQSRAVQLATHSSYSHMGIVVVRDARPFVLEAIERVTLTPLDRWVARGAGSRFVAKRLRNADRVLAPPALERLLSVGRGFPGKQYDPYFDWSDDRMYCSELVWKIYDRALGMDVGALQSIRQFDLSDPIVQAKVRERWGGMPPDSVLVISPAAMFASDLLVMVHRQ